MVFNNWLNSDKLKESDIRPREIPPPKDSVFLADMRSRQESSKALQEPGTNFLEGVENDVAIVSEKWPFNEYSRVGMSSVCIATNVARW